MNPIKHLLKTRMGFHAETVGSSAVDRIICSRMRVNGLIEHKAYLELLRQSPAEWDDLVESVVVTETWFFRDKPAFQAMARLAMEQWLPTNPTGVMRLLSVPCSSGEEPYSMSMALIDAGFPPDRFQIDAMDISERTLERARKAVYGRNSFRGQSLGFRDQHFRLTKEGFALSPNIKNQTRFQKGNLLDASCLMQEGVYDFVFCRNLLIYFDAQTQERTLSKLGRLLNASSVLFLGAAEMPMALASGFASASLPFSFACRKVDSAASPATLRERMAETQANNKPPQLYRGRAGMTAAPKMIAAGLEFPSRPARVENPPADLDQARMLAEAGRLAEAADICEAHLQEHGVSASAYYLLGWVRHAAGAENQAKELYRRALYLEPNHYETLTQWASLSSKNGDAAHARLLQERAERARKLD